MGEPIVETGDVLDQGGLQARRDVLLETCREALAEDDLATLRLILNDEHAADLAELLRLLDEADRGRCLGQLAAPLAARVMAELDPPTAVQVAGELGEHTLSGLVDAMAPDAAADVLGDLPEEHSERVLSLLSPDEADELRELMEHPEDSGGGIMTSRLLSVGDVSVAEAVDLLRRRAAEEEQEILRLYVVDDGRRLLGTVSPLQMLLADGAARLRDLAEPGAISVRADMDQEEIASIFADYDLLSLPVVDDEGGLVGQVTVDDIVDVIREEATEDNLKMAATGAAELEDPSVLDVVRLRLPWLLFCLAGTLLSGGVLDLFSGLLGRLGALVLFVPAIMAMGGNSGIQTSTVTVRSLATGLLHPDRLRHTLWREFRVAGGMGLFLGGLVYVVAHLWTAGSPVAPCAGLSMFAAVVLSAILGALIPLLFRSLSVDPAVASGPLITTLNDVLSLLIYFGVATVLLGWLAA